MFQVVSTNYLDIQRKDARESRMSVVSDLVDKYKLDVETCIFS